MRERIAILKSEITNDQKKMSRLFSRFEESYNEFLRSNEYSRLVESAFHVSQLYSGMENIFKNIAKTFENNIEQDYWHKSLLERMCLDIQDIRPALVSEGSFKYLNELRAFRHFFRHAYDIDIDKERFKIVADGVIALKASFEKDIKKFLSFLDMLLK
jgi:hypothetical protein